MCCWSVPLLSYFLVYSMLLFMKLLQFLVSELLSPASMLTVKLSTKMTDTYVQLLCIRHCLDTYIHLLFTLSYELSNVISSPLSDGKLRPQRS